MSANLEKAIRDELRELTDEQQRQVMAFVGSLKPKTVGNEPKRYSFVGIARSGKLMVDKPNLETSPHSNH